MQILCIFRVRFDKCIRPRLRIFATRTGDETGRQVRNELEVPSSLWFRVLKMDYPEKLAEILDQVIAECRRHGPLRQNLAVTMQ